MSREREEGLSSVDRSAKGKNSIASLTSGPDFAVKERKKSPSCAGVGISPDCSFSRRKPHSPSKKLPKLLPAAGLGDDIAVCHRCYLCHLCQPEPPPSTV